MYCRHCGGKIESLNVCNNCGNPPSTGRKYCDYCGDQLAPGQYVCTHCGNSIEVVYQTKEERPVSSYSSSFSRNNSKIVYDKPDALANLAGACCWNPIVGIIIYIIWKEEKPDAADSVCYWTLGGFILSLILSGILFLMGAI